MAEWRRLSPVVSAGERPGVGAVTRTGCLVRGFGPVGGAVGGQIENVRGLAERGRRLALVAGAHRDIGTQIGVVARIGCQVLTQAFATTTDMLNAA